MVGKYVPMQSDDTFVFHVTCGEFARCLSYNLEQLMSLCFDVRHLPYKSSASMGGGT